MKKLFVVHRLDPNDPSKTLTSHVVAESLTAVIISFDAVDVVGITVGPDVEVI